MGCARETAFGVAGILIGMLSAMFVMPSAPGFGVDESLKLMASKALAGSTGTLFRGNAVRDFKAQLRYAVPGADLRAKPSIGWSLPLGAVPNCSHWGVTTTISAVTPSVERVLALGHPWCVVIVADRRTPVPYFRGTAPANAIFLSVDAQTSAAKYAPYIAKVPWNHFGRKNIGYLFAVHHGAEVIFDFDDDNELKQGKWPLAQRPSPEAYDVPEQLSPVFNPYPIMGASNPAAWPRGFPMLAITNRSSYDVKRRAGKTASGDVVVFQSLADQDPDVDAIYRLTQRQLRFSFDAKQAPLAVPRGVLTPYNAQASVHVRDAFWALLLPVSVPGRVSDIWRGYIAQRLLWDLRFSVAFVAPLVDQRRNWHNYLADMSAEVDLYFKTDALVRFLGAWDGSRLTTLPARMEQLYVDLYRRKYLEFADVVAVQDWLSTLQAVGYQFPTFERPESRPSQSPSAATPSAPPDAIAPTAPTIAPTSAATTAPTIVPTAAVPIAQLTALTTAPTISLTTAPTTTPTVASTTAPTFAATAPPVTAQTATPTSSPSPTWAPTAVTVQPSLASKSGSIQSQMGRVLIPVPCDKLEAMSASKKVKAPFPSDFDRALTAFLLDAGSEVHVVCTGGKPDATLIADLFPRALLIPDLGSATVSKVAFSHILLHSWDACKAGEHGIAAALGSLTKRIDAKLVGYFEGYGKCDGKELHFLGTLHQATFLSRSPCKEFSKRFWKKVPRLGVLREGWGFDDCAEYMGDKRTEDRVCFLGKYRVTSYLKKFCDIASLLPQYTFVSFEEAGSLRSGPKNHFSTYCKAKNIDWISQDRKRALGSEGLNKLVASCSVHLDFSWEKGYYKTRPTTKTLHAMACGAAPVVEDPSDYKDLGVKYGSVVNYKAAPKDWVTAIVAASAKLNSNATWYRTSLSKHQAWPRIAEDYVAAVLAPGVSNKCEALPGGKLPRIPSDRG